MSLLPTGNVISWDGFSAGPNSEQIWNPTTSNSRRSLTGATSSVPGTSRWLTAEHSSPAGTSRPTTASPTRRSSTRARTRGRRARHGRRPLVPDRHRAGDGRVLAFSGDNIIQDRPGQPPPFSDASVNSLPEIYDPVRNTWTDLDRVEADPVRSTRSCSCCGRPGPRRRPGHDDADARPADRGVVDDRDEPVRRHERGHVPARTRS